jgi:TetR/AcrR family transcriptional repressor of nem operon
MRYQPDHAEQTRARIVAVAAGLIRRHGPDGVGVAALMKEAGLTHGGFYKHFPSKDALVAAAIDEMFGASRALIDRVETTDAPERVLRRYVNAYLSAEHRDAPETGCPAAALASDLHRLDLGARHRFEAGVAAIVERIAAHVPGRSPAERERFALSLFSEMIGALALARAAVERGRSDRLLADARAALKERIAGRFRAAEAEGH